MTAMRMNRAQVREKAQGGNNPLVTISQIVSDGQWINLQLMVVQLWEAGLLPNEYKTCEDAAKKINMQLKKEGYFERSGRGFAKTTQERDSILNAVLGKLYEA